MDAITWACAAFIVGIALGPWIGGGAGWVCVAAAAGLAALPFGGLSGWRGRLAMMLVGLALCRGQPQGPILRGDVVLVGVRVGAASGSSGDVLVGQHRRVGGEWVHDQGRVRVRFPDRPPPAGVEVVVWGRGVPATVAALPGSPDEARAAARVGIRSRLLARQARVLGAPSQRLGPSPDPTGMLAALALGDRSGVDPKTVQILRGTGTSHLLAISGFHVGVVAMLGVALGGFLRRLLAVVFPGGLPELEWIGGVALALAYTLAADAPISAQRAAGLLALGALGRLMGRRPQVEPLLGLVAVAVLWIDPAAVSTPSFQLSFGAVLGLIRVGTPLMARLPQGRLAWLTGGLAATVGATVGTLPAAAWWFQELAPLSPLANIVALPLTSAVLVPAAAVAAFGPEPLAGWAAAIGTLAAQWLLWGLEPLAVEPFRPAVGPVGALVLLLALALIHRPGLAALLTGLALAFRPLPRVDTFTFLAVGQGDATLFEGADGRRVLVDGGPHPDAVAAWLRRRGLRRIDAVIASHNQRDHMAGLTGVLGTLRVGQLEVSAHEGLGVLKGLAERRGVPILPAKGLHPDPLFQGSPNDRSVVLGIGPVLLTGDIEAAGEAALVPHVTPFPVLHVPHHGSRTSSSPALLDAVQPQLAIVSVGAGNPWGHPRPEVLRRYAERGIRVLRTDVHGTLVLSEGQLHGHRPGHGWADLGRVPAVTGPPRG